MQSRRTEKRTNQFRSSQQPDLRNRYFGPLVVFLLLFCVIAGAIFLTSEKIVLQKFLLALVKPMGLCWVALITLTYLLITNGQRFLGFFAMSITLFFSLAGNGAMVNSLASVLERPYLDFQVTSAPRYDCLVLLGGGTSFKQNQQSQLGSSGDRVMVAAAMYHQGKVEKILCTGTVIKQFAVEGVPSGGEQARELLIRVGVPEEKIELISGRNTREEMRSLSKRFSDSDDRVGLISSAWHLPRVMRLAVKNGVRAEPVPSDFMTGFGKFTILSLIPSSGAMQDNTKLLKELLAEKMGQ